MIHIVTQKPEVIWFLIPHVMLDFHLCSLIVGTNCVHLVMDKFGLIQVLKSLWCGSAFLYHLFNSFSLLLMLCLLLCYCLYHNCACKNCALLFDMLLYNEWSYLKRAYPVVFVNYVPQVKQSTQLFIKRYKICTCLKKET